MTRTGMTIKQRLGVPDPVDECFRVKVSRPISSEKGYLHHDSFPKEPDLPKSLISRDIPEGHPHHHWS
jgi:hypothetical protein